MASKLPDKVEQIITMFKRYLAAVVDDEQEYERRKGFVAGFFYLTRKDKSLTKKYFEKKFKAKDMKNFDLGFSLSYQKMWDDCKLYHPEFDIASPAHQRSKYHVRKNISTTITAGY